MKIKTVSVKNFRGIGGETATVLDFNDFNIIIGDNGTSKTAILEAINLCLSSSYVASRLSIDDFYRGADEPIEIKIFFTTNFEVEIPDIYGFGVTQKITCNGIALTVKKRDRSGAGKAFNDLAVPEHYYLPVEVRSEKGWVITRKNGKHMEITERQLALSYATASQPNPFYFGKNRDRQLKKGYNTSMSNIIEELNWRFEKAQRAKEDVDKFKYKRDEIEKNVFKNTDGDALKKTVDETNKTLEEYGIPLIDLSLIKTLTPYDNSEVVRRFDGFELPVSLSGSGIEMIIALTFLETLAKISKNEICIIIDEPELHLHPLLQDKLAQHLHSVSKDSQVFISTHSPFFFKNCFDKPEVNVLISEIEDDKVVISDAKNKGFGLLKWSPSWGEINYLAYNLPTVEFHDDLYSTIEDKLKIYPSHKISQDDVEKWFNSKGITTKIKWPDANIGPNEETLMTFVRNRIHHPDNTNRPHYTYDQLIESIRQMIILIKL